MYRATWLSAEPSLQAISTLEPTLDFPECSQSHTDSPWDSFCPILLPSSSLYRSQTCLMLYKFSLSTLSLPPFHPRIHCTMLWKIPITSDSTLDSTSCILGVLYHSRNESFKIYSHGQCDGTGREMQDTWAPKKLQLSGHSGKAAPGSQRQPLRNNYDGRLWSKEKDCDIQKF